MALQVLPHPSPMTLIAHQTTVLAFENGGCQGWLHNLQGLCKMKMHNLLFKKQEKSTTKSTKIKSFFLPVFSVLTCHGVFLFTII